MTTATTMTTAPAAMTATAGTCPECAEPVPAFDNLRVSSIVVCPSCAVELELIGKDPVEFALAPEIEEDFGE